MSCPYKHFLGVPGYGVHAHRIFGYALVDILLTIIVAVITTFFIDISLISSLISWFIMAEVFHYGFGVRVNCA